MFPTRRGSHTSLPGVGPKQLCSFQTIPVKATSTDGSNQVSSKLEIVLVHGCCSPRAHGVEKSLRNSMISIAKGVGQRRVHVFGFNAVKLLRKGKPMLHELARHLLEAVKSIPDRRRVAVVAHNTAAWVVREAVVQSQYDGELEKVPVGLVDFGLPMDLLQNYWDSEANWNEFRNGLLKHLTKGLVGVKVKLVQGRDKSLRKEYPMLDSVTVASTVQAFKKFRQCLSSPADILPILPICCPEREIVRRATGSSEESKSSTGSDNNSGIMFVSMLSNEEEEIIEFLKGVSENSPAPIPTLPKTSISNETAPGRRSSTRSASRGRHGASYDTRSNRSSYASGPSSSTYEHEFGPMQMSSATPVQTDGAETPRFSIIETSRRSESPQPLSLPLQKSGLDRRQKSVGFKEADQQKSVDSSQVDGNKRSHLGSQKTPLSIPKAIPEKSLKESKDIASWCFQNGDLEEANRLYQILITWCELNRIFDRGYYKMQLQIGQIRFIQGYYKSSEQMLTSLLEEQYKQRLEDPLEAALTSEIARWLALSQWRLGKYSEAQSTLDDYRRRQPINRDDLDLLSTLALVLASAGSFKRAWKLSIKAINRNSIEAPNSVIYSEKDTSSARRSSRLLNHARISSVIGRLEDADEANREALDDMKRRLGPKHFITLDASSFQAWLLVARSKTSQAAEAVHRTLHQMIERLGENHPSTLQTLETLVQVYKSEGRYSDAEKTVTYLLSKNNEVLGASHPQTLKSKTILAEILLACGKWKEAEKTQREVVELEQSRPDTDIDYPGLYSYKTTLANILRESGRWDEARTLSLHVLAEQLHKFGNEDDNEDVYQKEAPDAEPLPENEYIPVARLQGLLSASKSIMEELHKLPSGLHNPLADSQPVKIYPSIIQTLHCLALCEQIRDDADLRFARGILKIVRDIRLRRLGVDHRYTINVQFDLAVSYRLRGRFRKSLETIEDVAKRRRGFLGADHPDYLCANHEEAVALFRLGRWKQALEKQRRTLKVQEFLLGQVHPDTVLSRYTLSGIYHSLNQFVEADKLLEQVITEQRETYGEDHPIVLRSRARHALILLDKGNFQDAEKEQRIVVAIREKTLPKRHSLIRSARNDLAQIVQADGRLEEALSIYQDLVDSLPTHGKSMTGFEVRSNLGSCYFELQKYEEAERIQREIYEELKAAKDTSEDSGRLVASTFNLALTLRQRTLSGGSREQLKEACKLLKEAVDQAQGVLGPDHPQTVELRATLSAWRREEEAQQMGHLHTDSRQDFSVSVATARW